VPDPRALDFVLVIEKLKNHKSPGIDPTPAEFINLLNTDLNPICHLLLLLGAHHILHVNRIRVKSGHRKICYEIYKLIVSIWNKEELPAE
jgi:hypothetical protein